MTPANKITAELLDRIPREFPNIRLWRSNRVKAKVRGAGGRTRFLDAGINGQGDLTGVIGPHGRRLEIEVKAGRDDLSLDQIRFGSMIRAHGALYVIARDLENCLKSLHEVIDEQ